MLVSPRDTITIKRQLRAAMEAGTLAESRRQQAETMRLGARGSIEAKKVEIDQIKERINLARKENREADRLGLEAERKAAEREKGLLERREELRQAESDLEANRAELAGLTQKALELELQLAIRRAGRSRTPHRRCRRGQSGSGDRRAGKADSRSSAGSISVRPGSGGSGDQSD